MITYGIECRRRSRVVAGLFALGVLASCASGSVEVDEAPAGAPVTSVASSDDLASDVFEETTTSSTTVIANTEGIVTSAPNATESVLPDGFGSVTARVTSVDGEVCEVCLWLADTDALRQRGLMGVTDLGDAVGMAFRWDEPHAGNFFMFQTPTPLSIAWFSDSGEHVGQADMEPCLVDDSATCERYTASAPYTLAIEMFGGQLDTIGIGPDSTVELRDLPCA